MHRALRSSWEDDLARVVVCHQGLACRLENRLPGAISINCALVQHHMHGQVPAQTRTAENKTLAENLLVYFSELGWKIRRIW